MANGRLASVSTIDPGTPFVDILAAGLRHRFREPLALSRVTVLLPTRRACRALGEAFLRVSDGVPLLLPVMRPIGDVDEDELALAPEAFEAPLAGNAADTVDLTPAIAPLRRQLLLTKLILKFGASASERGGGYEPAQAAELAVELGRLLDQVQTTRLSFDALAGLVPDDYAAHWRVTLDFLKILTEHWPRHLDEEGLIDPAQRRNQLIKALAARWRQAPPAEPVIAAGSTGSIPATAELLHVIAALPAGEVVLPGLDREMAAESWDLLGPGDPQFGIKQLLSRMGLEREEIASWPVPGTGGDTGGDTGRAAFISEAMRPAETTEAWHRIAPPPERALDGLTVLEALGAKEEAGVIALTMRETLETPGRTAALVTPDRRLARRVSAELRRWGLDVDDSGGIPLADTPPGAYLRLVAEMIASKAAPVPLLSALKHPLAAGGIVTGAFRANVRRLERGVLRGPRPAPGFKGLIAALAAGSEDDALASWFRPLAEAAQPFAAALGSTRVSLDELLKHHIEFAEWLAADEDGGGSARLWAGEAGEAASVFIAELIEATPAMAPLAGAAYPALLDRLMRGRVVRPRHGGHPRLNIWGLLEARLQHADVLVLGGLNEGTWPAEAPADPWMSRPMRKAFGLPAHERRIGLAAHDFVQAACAREVVLTRAAKVDGAPTVPSRWWLRLENLLKASGLELPGARRGAELRRWQRLLDEPARIKPAPPPRPKPPVAARPRQLSVTQVETWMRDPYAIYARHILGLRALEPLDADPGAAERGIFIHEALDSFLSEFREGLPQDAYERLLEHGREAFGAALERPGVSAFWWPRFARVAAWFVDQERDRPATTRTLATEVRARLALPGRAGDFVLTATADRIDRVDGGLVIIDYKTGAVPSKQDIISGYAPQLPLEAMLAEAGAFEDVGAEDVREIAFWHLAGGEPAGRIHKIRVDAHEVAATARKGLERLIAAFDKEKTPYFARPRPEAAPRYSDYEHLARIKEWSAGGRGGAS